MNMTILSISFGDPKHFSVYPTLSGKTRTLRFSSLQRERMTIHNR